MAIRKHLEKKKSKVGCAVITVSDTRNKKSDTSGALIRERLEAAGHRICHDDIVPDDTDGLQDHLIRLCDRSECQAVLLTGGTGIAPRDHTFEAVTALLDRRLDGFGELFRMLSFAEVGAVAMLSRAVAGVRGKTLIFAMPGSPAAVELAMDKLILPALGHAASQVNPA